MVGRSRNSPGKATTKATNARAAAAAALINSGFCQCQGSSSWMHLAGWLGRRARTASQVRGSIPFSLALSIRGYIVAARRPSRSRRMSNCRLRLHRQPRALGTQPGSQVFGQRAGSLIADGAALLGRAAVDLAFDREQHIYPLYRLSMAIGPFCSSAISQEASARVCPAPGLGSDRAGDWPCQPAEAGEGVGLACVWPTTIPRSARSAALFDKQTLPVHAERFLAGYAGMTGPAANAIN